MFLRMILNVFSLLVLFSCRSPAPLVTPPREEGVAFSTHFEESFVKFCLTADTGMRTELQLKIAQLLKNERCDRIIILGDIIYPDGISSAEDEQIKTKFEDFYLPLTLIDKKPQIALINGNHDYRGNPLAWVEAAKTRPWLIMPERYYMEDVHGFCFYYLDSPLLIEASYDVSEKQLSWLTKVREEMQESCKAEIVLTHHPYISEGKYENATGHLKEVYESYIVNKVDFHIAGHSHILKDFGKIGKTHFLISGTGGEVYEGFEGGILVLEMGLVDHTLQYKLKKISNL